MDRRTQCRSEGCSNEVLYKTVVGEFDDRRGSGRKSPRSPNDRGSPSGPYHRYSNSSIYFSPFCKQHTCIHFHGDENCINQKPRHDTVCAIHTRCPVPNCTQARAQFLDPNVDPLSNAVPRYARYDVCSDHRCRTTGCRSIVESDFPYCAMRTFTECGLSLRGPRLTVPDIKCAWSSCGEARHFSARTNDCQYPRPWTASGQDVGHYCPLHTCRRQMCHAHVDRLALFCITHFKEHYIAQGKR
ncbi:uncharacterized protein THITE_2025341, partial [Thermothielavioides terrestris NRRL 8126]